MTRLHRLLLPLLFAGLMLTISVGLSSAQEDDLPKATQKKTNPSKAPGPRSFDSPQKQVPEVADPFGGAEPGPTLKKTATEKKTAAKTSKTEPAAGEKTKPVQTKNPETPPTPEVKAAEVKNEDGKKAESAAPSLTELKGLADATKTQADNLKIAADTVWVMLAAFLVFFMNLGFACVESGFCRAKNCVNILSKNFIVFAATTFGFWIIGWGLMFGNGSEWYGTAGMLFANDGVDNSPVTTDFAGLIKDDIKADPKFGIDLKDEAVAKESKYEPTLKAIEEAKEKFVSSITANKKKIKKDGKEEEADVTFAVKIPVPDKGTFEKDYAASSAYWGPYSAISWTGVPFWAKFFFQLVFAGTAATIVSGAVAERIKYHSFILFSLIMAIAIYPIVGHWIWGGGYLAAKWNFLDFAGSTQVHSIGGWAALTGALILGPRIGKYSPDGKVHAIPGHNLTAATIGCFVLWFGWFGFNPGSTMLADGNQIAEIAMTTNTAAAIATLTATITAWLLLGKPDLGMTLNGCLAGLVAITAPCAFVTVGSAAVIGAIAGVLVVLAVIFFDKIRLDDPVGATSVHLVNGVFGTLCVGIFAEPSRVARSAPAGMGNWSGLLYGGGTGQLIGQAVGVATVAVYVLVISATAWLVLKYTVGIRVSREEETEGLDIGEHGNEAYHGFVMATGDTMTAAEPRPATVPPGSTQRFSVVVSGVVNGELMHVWSDLCQPGKAVTPEFKAIYPYMTTVQGNRFNFRGGDPEMVRLALQTVFKGKLKGPIQTHVERY